jgi:membrane fusion protein, multidrug efflux system
MSEGVVPPPSHKTSKKWMWISTGMFLSLAVAFLIYWLVWGQYHETNNDTYVNGNMIILTPQVSGIITRIYTDNTQMVQPGHPILDLDRHHYEIALDESKAYLADTVRQVEQMFLKVDELAATKEARMAEVLRSFLDFEHRKALVIDGSISRENYEHSLADFVRAYAVLEEVEKQYEQAVVAVRNVSVPTHPKVEEAKARLRQAFLSLHRCTVRAPARGIITQRKAQVGQWVNKDDPLMALIPLDQIWVDSNFREVSLRHFRIGQPVTMFSDMYGRGVKFHGKLVGLNPGTGSVLSVLPPQNATGNWIKIVQRIPVKVSLDPDELARYPLVVGLSMTATVDTHNRRGSRLPEIALETPLYCTDTYEDELVGVEEMIDAIVTENMAP